MYKIYHIQHAAISYSSIQTKIPILSFLLLDFNKKSAIRAYYSTQIGMSASFTKRQQAPTTVMP